VNHKIVIVAPLAALCLGCGMSDQDIRQKTGDAAIAVKHAAETAGDKLKGAYSDAAEKGKEAMKNAGDKLSDEALKAKVNAGFGLVAGLDAKNISVDVRNGKVYLSGSVPTQLDKMKAEGVAYGVTGDSSKYESTIEVK
jgi:osmotically-inducible protein OsmY